MVAATPRLSLWKEAPPSVYTACLLFSWFIPPPLVVLWSSLPKVCYFVQGETKATVKVVLSFVGAARQVESLQSVGDEVLNEPVDWLYATFYSKVIFGDVSGWVAFKVL